jgi:hypothetical protein
VDDLHDCRGRIDQADTAGRDDRIGAAQPGDRVAVLSHLVRG